MQKQVLEHAHKVLAAFKVPKRVVFAEALPEESAQRKNSQARAARGAFRGIRARGLTGCSLSGTQVVDFGPLKGLTALRRL